MPATQNSGVIRFGPFEADLRTRELRKNGLKLKLQDQPFQVLAMLLERPGELVTREEIRAKLWSEDTFVDFDHGLNAAVRRLREALNDNADLPRFVQTLPRHGYRFIAPVEPLFPVPPSAGNGGEKTSQGNGSAAHGLKIAPAVAAGKRWARLSWIQLGGLTIGALVATLVILFAFNVAGLRVRLMTLTGRRGTPLPKIGSIAVLPLENLSRDPKEDYFADGMTDELIATLAKVQALRVISRTSVQRYKKTNETLPQIAHELNVNAILEGTVMHADGRVRITAELVNSADRQLWANSFESNERDVLLLQDEMARAIADGISLKLQPGDQARLAAGAIDPQAHDDYLESLFYYYRESRQDLPKAVQYLEQAIRLKPNYAEAYALLAACYYDSSQSRLGNVPNAAAADEAKATALKALRLDDSLAEPHVVLGAVADGHDWNWAVAETELKRAIQLDPSLVQAHVGYAWHLLFTGRKDQAIQEVNRAVDLDPVSRYTLAHRVYILVSTRHYKQGIERAQKALEMFPEEPEFYANMSTAYAQLGMYDKAVAARQQALKLSGEKPAVVSALGEAFKARGFRGVWQWQLDQFLSQQRAGHVDAYGLASCYSVLGEKDKAFDWLEKVYARRSDEILFVRVDPDFDGLRSEPRFQSLMARLNFPQ